MWEIKVKFNKKKLEEDKSLIVKILKEERSQKTCNVVTEVAGA